MHSNPVSDLSQLLRSMSPVCNPGAFVFASLPDGVVLDAADVVASIREPDAVSVIVSIDVAHRASLPSLFPCVWITLEVHSALHAVGLTAAVATALGDAAISCNVVAGARHDHLFVPIDRADEAMAVLRALQHRHRDDHAASVG